MEVAGPILARGAGCPGAGIGLFSLMRGAKPSESRAGSSLRSKRRTRKTSFEVQDDHAIHVAHR